MRTVLLVAETDGDTFGRLTGLRFGAGFVGFEGGVGGLYPGPMGKRVAAAMTAAGVTHHITPAETIGQGLRKLCGVVLTPPA